MYLFFAQHSDGYHVYGQFEENYLWGPYDISSHAYEKLKDVMYSVDKQCGYLNGLYSHVFAYVVNRDIFHWFIRFGCIASFDGELCAAIGSVSGASTPCGERDMVQCRGREVVLYHEHMTQV